MMGHVRQGNVRQSWERLDAITEKRNPQEYQDTKRSYSNDRYTSNHSQRSKNRPKSSPSRFNEQRPVDKREHTQNNKPTSSYYDNQKQTIMKSVDSSPYNPDQSLFLHIIQFQTLSQSKFGTIKFATNYLQTLRCAVKTYFVKQLTKQKIKKINRQAQTLLLINHPNIIKIYGRYQHPYHIKMVMQYGGDTNLQRFLEQKGRLSQKEVRLIFKQILTAFSYLEERQICHLNLNPSKIMLNQQLHVKIIGFGSNLRLQREDKPHFSPMENYLAPQLSLKRENYDGLHLDRWSLGVLLYHMLTGDLPFSDRIQLLKGELKNNTFLTKYQLKMIKNFVEVKPNLRISCKEALTNPWFGL